MAYLILTDSRRWFLMPNIVEFGKPSDLLKIEDGKFNRMADENGDKDILYKMMQ